MSPRRYLRTEATGQQALPQVRLYGAELEIPGKYPAIYDAGGTCGYTNLHEIFVVDNCAEDP